MICFGQSDDVITKEYANEINESEIEENDKRQRSSVEGFFKSKPSRFNVAKQQSGAQAEEHSTAEPTTAA